MRIAVRIIFKKSPKPFQAMLVVKSWVCFFSLSLLLMMGGTVNGQNPGGVSSNLTFWLKSDGTTSSNHNVYNTSTNTVPCSDGQGVYHWNNSKATNPVTQLPQSTASSQPLFYNTTAANLFNFNPTIRFDGIDDVLRNSSVLGSDIFAGDKNSLFMAMHYTGPDGTGVWFKWEDAPTASNRIGYESTGISNDYLRFDVFNNNCGSSADCADRQNKLSSGKIDDLYRVSTAYHTTDSSYVNIDGNLESKIKFVKPTAGSYTNINVAQTQQLCLGGNSTLGAGNFPTAIDFSEVIVYKTRLNNTDVSRVESYMATKYGVTLNHNYIASDGTTKVWDKTKNASYNSNIIGIARDDNTGLLQKQSHSMTTFPFSDITTLYIDNKQINNQDNTGAFVSGDKSFFMMGSNAGGLTGQTTEIQTNILKTLTREWFVQKTNFTNTDVSIEFDLSSVSSFGPLTDLVLLIDNDGNFSNSTILYPWNTNSALTGTTFKVTIDAASLTASPYITLAIADPTILPVELTSFNASCKNGKTTLVWNTASEKNNEYFIVEYSTNGKNFFPLTTIPAAGNSNINHKYAYIHYSRSNTNYYRLTQVDFDGKVTYSIIQSASCSGTDTKLSIYPQPTAIGQELTIELQNPDINEKYETILYDISGRAIKSAYLSSDNSILKINTNNLSSGIYYVSVKGTSVNQGSKLIIQ